jgi:hypothetical protein
MDTKPLNDRLRIALAETACLRAENERLRKLLRIREVCPEIVPASEIQGTQPADPLLTAGEKIRLFRNLFRGREDVYAVRWESTPLIADKLLVPLGKPAPNAPKYFATVDILAAAQDREWLSQATKALSRYRQAKNSRKKPIRSGVPNFDTAA